MGLVSCGGGSEGGGNPSGPSPTPTPSTFTLTGSVSSTTGGGIGGATVTVVDGANAGKSATTDGAGSFSLTSLQPGGFTVRARAQYYEEASVGVTVTSNTSTSLSLRPIPPFSHSGTGDTVFDMPTSVSRVRVIGTYGGFCQNFIVRVRGSVLVNEILGSCSSASGRTYDAIRLTTGGVVEIVSSSGVQWSFTEVR